MYNVIHYVRDGEARYWSGSSFSFNPFNAVDLTYEAAGYIFQELIEKGYDRNDLEICPA